MLTIFHSVTFNKHFDVLPNKIKQKTINRLAIFMQDEYAELLNNHALHGEYDGCRSINITGDFRLVYEKVDKDIRRLLDIGSHSQLYE